MKKINRISQIICLAALGFIVWTMLFDQNLKGSSFGPAAYYYTDVPDWQDRFYGSARLVLPESDALLWPAILLSLAGAGLLLKLLLRFHKGSRSSGPNGAAGN